MNATTTESKEVTTSRTSHTYTTRSRGPKHIPVPMDRRVKTYPISEHELNALGILSTVATFFFSLSSAASSFVVGLLLDVAQEKDAATKNMPAVHFICWSFGLAALVFVILGIVCCVKKKNELAQIKSEVTED